ncbi:glycoside hydrolase family 113 [Jiulongibacter sp. NS-SX5]|uniref:glycoside hydrolase family 113 n=1 Tax=Jiulongibacter sp. NS-SX5 TaxID=3463854 RepID=UPI0040596442
MKTKLLTSGILLILVAVFFLNREQKEPFTYNGEKVNGLSFVATRDTMTQDQFKAVKRVNAEWVAFMPYGFVGEENTELRFVREGAENSHQWWGETPEGIKTSLGLARKEGLSIMMKPHIWIRRGTFTGDFALETEEEWNAFERTYAEYMLQYARIAQSFNVELFCIGTEMETMVRERPDFFPALIKAIKKVYRGQLTYAENWDVYDEVPFWNQLDYIGVDAYFPLANGENPDKKSLQRGWKKHLKELTKFSAELQKPVLFTEYGYRSCDFSTEKPWETDYSLPDNEELQARAYEVLYEEVWSQQWFAGGFFWKWFPKKQEGRASRDKFCPQHKLAESVIAKHYGK